MDAPQTDKSHYAIGSYGFEGRFVSYFHQLHEVLSLKPRTILEVGVGDRVFGDFIRNNTGVGYTSVDIAPDLHPDVLGSVTKLPFADNSFDVVCAFEVLEHLPFEEFDVALSELARVAKRAVILSLPHFGPMLSFSLKVPFIPQLQCAVKLPVSRTHAFNGQHYWEIGKRGYPLSLIRTKLHTIGVRTKDFIPFNSPYHHFFTIDVSKQRGV
ncbi:MAG: class I SAM-dependent methyltransferase [Patescibacteria group bacterium]